MFPIRFRVRSLMIAVGVAALLMGASGPGRRWYRRVSYYRSQAATYARLEGSERLRSDRERKASSDRGGIRSRLIRTQGFAARSPRDLERAVDRVVEAHRRQADEALGASERWGEERGRCVTAAFWAWDPFAPDVP